MSKTDLKGLHQNTIFSESAFIVLKHKFNVSRKKARIFLDDPTVENLHSLRISIRRLRYSLEIFEVCFSRDSFRKNISYLKSLQDLIGIGRDLDVLKDEVNNIALEGKTVVPVQFFDALDKKKEKALHEIKLELLKFLHNKNIRNFFNKKEDLK